MTTVISRGAQVNTERDYNHATDSTYTELRNNAEQAQKKAQSYSAESQDQYKSGNKAKAKELSDLSKQQYKISNDFNMKAAEFVFVENNNDSDSNEIDLHGLYVKEAVWIMQKRIAIAAKNGEPKLEVIVGKGKHSKDGISKIKFAIENLCNENHITNYIDKKNTGVLIVELNNVRVPADWETMTYSTYIENLKSKPQQAYHPQQQPQYNAPQQQQYNQQQQQQPQEESSFLSKLLQLACICIQKNM